MAGEDRAGNIRPCESGLRVKDGFNVCALGLAMRPMCADSSGWIPGAYYSSGLVVDGDQEG